MPLPRPGPRPQRRSGRVSDPVETDRTPESDAVAIIGLSGRYPQAPDLDAFWANLEAGRNCVTEIPADRWRLEGFFETDPERAVAEGKSYSKWGGFLEDFACFDPLFFNIPPSEALRMDPQERLFLQAVWEALEDAGHTRATLAERYGGRVGRLRGRFAHRIRSPWSRVFLRRVEVFQPRTSFGSIANRVSYFLDIHGPSMPVDTMCSSSLTAIHGRASA